MMHDNDTTDDYVLTTAARSLCAVACPLGRWALADTLRARRAPHTLRVRGVRAPSRHVPSSFRSSHIIVTPKLNVSF